MFYKSRVKPRQLAILESLNNRMALPAENLQNYSNLKKGYEGELMFDALLESLECECLVLNDLLLKANNQTFQIDSLLIFNDAMFIFEIKNYAGDFYYDSDRFVLRNKSETEISNPLIQLSRTESLLRQFLHKFNNTLPIESFIIFINHEFMLYQAPMDSPFIFPTQLNRFIKKLNMKQSKIHDNHKILADKIIDSNVKENSYQQIPHYNYESLQKGITCTQCDSFSLDIQHLNCICNDCESEESVWSAVLRSIEEFKLLFPNEKVTTNKMYDWCKIITSKKRIQRILAKNYTKVGVHQWQYFI